MGNCWSASPDKIDGLGYQVPDNYELQRPTAESAKKLDQLIKANNATYGVLWNDRKFHNHLPHALISAYFLGADPKQLTYIYEKVSQTLSPWQEDQPEEVTDEDWEKFLGKREYERGYFDFYSDKINFTKNSWKNTVKRYLVDEHDCLVNGVYGGLTHAIIHLGYAFEVDSAYLAVEALTLNATNYQSYDLKLPNVEKTTNDLMELVEQMRNDEDLDGLYERPSQDGPTACLDRIPEKLAYYTARLHIEDPLSTLKDILQLGALALLATHKDDKPAYSFFLLHLLTSSQEVCEILLSENSDEVIPISLHHKIIQDLWTTVVIVYITQLRPRVKVERVENIEIKSIPKAWQDAVNLVLNGPSKARTDEHFIKAIRALLFCEQFFNDETGFYAKGALQFAQSFSANPHYTGFETTPLLDVKQ